MLLVSKKEGLSEYLPGGRLLGMRYYSGLTEGYYEHSLVQSIRMGRHSSWAFGGSGKFNVHFVNPRFRVPGTVTLYEVIFLIPGLNWGQIIEEIEVDEMIISQIRVEYSIRCLGPKPFVCKERKRGTRLFMVSPDQESPGRMRVSGCSLVPCHLSKKITPTISTGLDLLKSWEKNGLGRFPLSCEAFLNKCLDSSSPSDYGSTRFRVIYNRMLNKFKR
jgi:hypothetical protein